MRNTYLVRIFAIAALFLQIIIPAQSAQGDESRTLTSCISMSTHKERILHDSHCIVSREFTANWHVVESDTVLPTSGIRTIKVCSNTNNSTSSYGFIRKACNRSQIETIYSRSLRLPDSPQINSIKALSDSTVLISLAEPASMSIDAPISYYTAIDQFGLTQKVFANGKQIYLSGLRSSTKYEFTLVAHSVDGSSIVSANPISVTTLVFVAPKRTATSAAFQSISVPATISSSDTAVAVSNPALLNLSLTFPSQGSAIPATFQTVANPSGSSPFTISGSTTIIDINMPGFSGTATLCFDGTSSDHLWHYVGGIWIDVTTSHPTGKVCGETTSFSPFTVASPTAENSCLNGGYCLLGESGPGGGTIFYKSVEGFKCGASWSTTGSPTGGLCHYLEFSPSTWYDGSADPTLKFSNYLDIPAPMMLTIETTPDPPAGTVTGGIGRGFKNSEILISGLTRANFPAADKARAYLGGNLHDWYLPNLIESNQLCKWSYGLAWVSDTTRCNMGGSILNYAGLSLSGADNAAYQVSDVIPWARQYVFKMKNASIGSDYAVLNALVRPIRAF